MEIQEKEEQNREGQEKQWQKEPKSTRLLMPRHGILLIVLTAVELTVAGFLFGGLGLYGSAISELLLLLLALGTVWIFHADRKAVFQLRKPKLSTTFGTLTLWLGSYLFIMMLTMFMTYFFPEPMTGVSESLGDSFASVPFLVSFVCVSILPAICEEAVFRGVFFNSLWNRLHKKWPVILIVSVVFGIFHGSIWRFVPTCLLGIAMGYLIFETNNMFYNMLFHAVNNAVPVILLFVMEKIYQMMGMGDVFTQAAEMEGIPLISLGIYLIYGAVGIFLVYIGRYLLHMGQPGYEKGLFPRDKKAEWIVMASICAGLVILGILVFVVSIGIGFGESMHYLY